MSVPNANPHVREMAGWLKHFGWEFAGHSGADHLRFVHAEYQPVDLACTPRADPRKPCLAEIARRLGKTKPEVEVALGLRPSRRSGPKVKRKRNEVGRAARTFEVYREQAPQPERVGSIRERMAAVASEIREVDARLNLAMGKTYDSLLSTRARLRGEYLQLETEREAA